MSRFGPYFRRSAEVLKDSTSRILRMQGADEPSRAPKTLFKFNTPEDIKNIATGCDADIGGKSTVHFDLDQRSAKMKGSILDLERPTGRFWGVMSLDVQPELQGKIRGGYAGFRSKRRTTLFGEMTDDVSYHRYLGLRVRAGGDPRTRNSYYVNIQTDGPIASDLWQHRLFFTREDGGWEDIFIPFDRFVLTNSGEIQPHQIAMFKERIRTIGISLLGGNSGVDGPYELGIDEIRAVNDEDVTVHPEKQPLKGTQWERRPVEEGQ